VNEIMSTDLLPGQRMSRKAAVERVVYFAQRFGEAHLALACHAAFPLVLTPDLLYCVRANFVSEAPWSAVADVLLSCLCREVGHELYEMEIAVRKLLVDELKQDERFGQRRLNDLANFLLGHASQDLDSSDPDVRNLAQAQQLTALWYTQPGAAARKLAQLRPQPDPEDAAEWLRVELLTRTLGPLSLPSITLTGPSMAGKSTVIRHLLALASEDFRPALVSKYTTRPPRNDDLGEVICKANIPAECDLVYKQYGARYGFELKTLRDLVDRGLNPIVIVNDFPAIKAVRQFLGDDVRSVFVWRESPLSEQFRELLIVSRGMEAGIVRFHQAQEIYRCYAENVSLFEHVILNCGSPDDLRIQVKQIVEGVRQSVNKPTHSKTGATCPQRLFVLVGTPGSGKDLLVQDINNQGTQHARIVPKHTSRKRQSDDGSEMICPGDPGHHLDGCDIVYENYGDQYGISCSMIRQGLDQGISQVVVVSNVDAINRLYEMFGDRTVLIYVH
jgi:ribose 1,5-bisphosphokinase PhnN